MNDYQLYHESTPYITCLTSFSTGNIVIAGCTDGSLRVVDLRVPIYAANGSTAHNNGAQNTYHSSTKSLKTGNVVAIAPIHSTSVTSITLQRGGSHLGRFVSVDSKGNIFITDPASLFYYSTSSPVYGTTPPIDNLNYFVSPEEAYKTNYSRQSQLHGQIAGEYGNEAYWSHQPSIPQRQPSQSGFQAQENILHSYQHSQGHQGSSFGQSNNSEPRALSTADSTTSSSASNSKYISQIPTTSSTSNSEFVMIQNSYNPQKKQSSVGTSNTNQHFFGCQCLNCLNLYQNKSQKLTTQPILPYHFGSLEPTAAIHNFYPLFSMGTKSRPMLHIASFSTAMAPYIDTALASHPSQSNGPVHPAITRIKHRKGNLMSSLVRFDVNGARISPITAMAWHPYQPLLVNAQCEGSSGSVPDISFVSDANAL
jgi:hypothetical protein